MGQKSFSEFVKEILEPSYDWYVKLFYPAPTEGHDDPEFLQFWKKARFTPEGRAALERRNEKKAKCIRNWIGEIMLHAGTQGFRYIKITEDQSDFSSYYHVLFGGCSTAGLTDRDWLKRWKEMSGGSAYERNLDDRIGGLLTHLVMKQENNIEVYLGDTKATYTKDDFRQWKPKD